MAIDFALPSPMLYTVVHLVAIIVGLYGVWWAKNAGQKLWMVVFGLWTVSELVYLGAHNAIGFTAGAAHVIQEVLLLVAFLYVVVKARK